MRNLPRRSKASRRDAFEDAADDRAATAQGDLSTIQAIVMAGATGCSGLLYGSFGSVSYGAMALLALLGGLIALTVRTRSSSP